MGWWITLGILILLAILPLGASVIYDEDGPKVWVIAGPVRIKVFPLKKKEKKEKPKKDTKQEEAAAPAQAAPAEKAAGAKDEKKPAPQQKKGGSILDFLPLVNVALDFLNDLRRKIRINHLKLVLTMAADDPCDLAVNYGRANAAMAALLAQLERWLVIKKREVRVNCDFTADETVILARLDLTITLGRILSLAVRYGIRALVTFMKIKKQQEGGANL